MRRDELNLIYREFAAKHGTAAALNVVYWRGHQCSTKLNRVLPEDYADLAASFEAVDNGSLRLPDYTPSKTSTRGGVGTFDRDTVLNNIPIRAPHSNLDPSAGFQTLPGKKIRNFP